MFPFFTTTPHKGLTQWQVIQRSTLGFASKINGKQQSVILVINSGYSVPIKNLPHQIEIIKKSSENYQNM